MKVNKEKAIEENSELKINVNEQNVEMKHLKKKIWRWSSVDHSCSNPHKKEWACVYNM